MPKGDVVSRLKSRKIISKGFMYHLVWFNNTYSKIPKLELFPVENEFLIVFHDGLPSVSLEREIRFSINLLPNMKPIAISP